MSGLHYLYLPDGCVSIIASDKEALRLNNELTRLRAEVARLRADQTIPPNERQPIVVQQRDAAWAESASRLTEIERLRAELDSIRQYGSDTLSGRTDGPDDRQWQRDAVLEMTNRASRALRGE